MGGRPDRRPRNARARTIALISSALRCVSTVLTALVSLLVVRWRMLLRPQVRGDAPKASEEANATGEETNVYDFEVIT